MERQERFYKINPRVNVLYYLDEFDNIKEEVMYKEKKVKVQEAKDYLKSKGIKYNELINILLQDIQLYIPIENIVNYIRK